MKQSLVELLEKVVAASGSDRELDADIAVAFWQPHGDYTRARKPIISDWGVDTYEEVAISGIHVCTAPMFTASVDAALALVERVLPGWGWEVHQDDDHFGSGPLIWWAAVRELTRFPTAYRARAKTPALACVAALLKAKIAETENVGADWLRKRNRTLNDASTFRQFRLIEAPEGGR